jgi:hypothetical protein
MKQWKRGAKRGAPAPGPLARHWRFYIFSDPATRVLEPLVRSKSALKRRAENAVVKM